MSNPKDQHYVPKFILREFAENGKILVLDRFNGRFYSKGPSEVFSERYLYSVKIGGRWSSDFEKIFSRIENDASRLIRKIIAGIDISDHEIFKIKLFISLQIRRNPKWISKFGDFLNKLYINELIDEFEKKTGIVAGKERRDSLTDDRAIRVMRKEATVKAIFDFDSDAFKIVESKSLIIGKANKNGQFIVGDYPHVSFNIDGIGHERNETFISISPEIIIGIASSEEKILTIKLNREQIRKYNILLFSKSRIVCSKNRALLDSLLRRVSTLPDNPPA